MTDQKKPTRTTEDDEKASAHSHKAVTQPSENQLLTKKPKLEEGAQREKYTRRTGSTAYFLRRAHYTLADAY